MKRSLSSVLVLGAALLVIATLAGGCGSSDAPAASPSGVALETRADSLAMQLYEAHGGPEVWQNTPALVFTFASDRPTESGDRVRQEVARHWWRRSDGTYRVEWSNGPDSVYTAVFNVNDFSPEAPAGRAALNETRLDSAAEQQALQQAHGRFANDTYWLLAPFKLFDEGVTRSVSADPARPDSAETLSLSFANVGITPGDRYWLTPDSTGRLGHWTFVLQGMGPEQPPGSFNWVGYETFSTPAGPLALSTRKENTRGPGTVYTDEIRTPDSLPDSLFSIGEE